MSLSKGYNIDQTIEELERYNNSYLKSMAKFIVVKGLSGLFLMKTMSLFSIGFKLLYDKIWDYNGGVK